MKIAYIKWEDASYTPKDIFPTELPSPMILHTVGWLVREDKNTVTITQEWAEFENTYRHTITILKKNIKRIRRIRYEP